MVLKYYGTGAAEGMPAIFCSCEVCERARRLGGRNIRTRSQALVNRSLLIDFPPDTMAHVLFYGLEMHKIKNLIITHNHGDHLMPYDLTQRQVGYAYLEDDLPLRVYASAPALRDIKTYFEQIHPRIKDRVLLKQYQSFTPFIADKIRVTPLKARHSEECEAHIFDLYDGEKRMLYGNDTGYFPEETWDYLAKDKPYYHIVSLDCTMAFKDIGSHHMGLDAVARVRDRLLGLSCADRDTKFIAHHFSHNGGATYDDLLPAAREIGFDVSYDTMEVEV